jgi:hypothetical protein
MRGSHGIAPPKRSRGSSLSRNYSICIAAKSCLLTGSCSTIELPRNVYEPTYYTPFSLLNKPNTRCYTVYMNKSCKLHGLTTHFLRVDGSYRCGKCASAWVIKNRRNKKEKLVKQFGGQCVVCGYKKYAGALDFHHTNPKNKSFALSVKGLSYSWDSLVEEAKKCVLVCKNCHTEIEAGLLKL